MKIEKGTIKKQSERSIYRLQVIFISDDNSKKSVVLAAASSEYLDDYYGIEDNNHLNDKHFSEWTQRIIDKWSNFGEKIFAHPKHYDPYTNTREGEANILDFLINEVSEEKKRCQA